jgi:hypothetical protein
MQAIWDLRGTRRFRSTVIHKTRKDDASILQQGQVFYKISVLYKNDICSYNEVKALLIADHGKIPAGIRAVCASST